MLYNHLYTIAFSVISPNDGKNVTAEEINAGLERRLRDIKRSGETLEAVGLADDSYVMIDEDADKSTMCRVSVAEATEEQINFAEI